MVASVLFAAETPLSVLAEMIFVVSRWSRCPAARRQRVRQARARCTGRQSPARATSGALSALESSTQSFSLLTSARLAVGWPIRERSRRDAISRPLSESIPIVHILHRFALHGVGSMGCSLFFGRGRTFTQRRRARRASRAPGPDRGRAGAPRGPAQPHRRPVRGPRRARHRAHPTDGPDDRAREHPARRRGAARLARDEILGLAPQRAGDYFVVPPILGEHGN